MKEPKNLFELEDYKAYLRQRVEQSQGFRGYQAQLAAATGCQRSFLSQVLHGEMHLTRDHAAEACRFWSLGPEESEYFVALVDLARAGSKALQGMLRTRLARLREEALNLSRRFANRSVSDLETQATYYSSWYWSAIHVIVSIPRLKTAPAIAERLKLPIEVVKSALLELERFGFVARKGNEWSIGKRDIHLDDDSPLNEVNHANWRARAIHNIQARDPESMHYTSVFSVSKKDAARMRQILVDAVVRSRELIPPSPEEELYCFTSSFFRA